MPTEQRVQAFLTCSGHLVIVSSQQEAQRLLFQARKGNRTTELQLLSYLAASQGKHGSIGGSSSPAKTVIAPNVKSAASTSFFNMLGNSSDIGYRRPPPTLVAIVKRSQTEGASRT